MKPYLAAAALALLAACSSGPEEIAVAGPARAPSEADAGRIMAHARALRKQQGCAAAAASYRVVAGMGEGFEAAQHELGECLLTLTGDRPEETTLLRDEALFWLTRAAYAGNARAQRTLASLYGAGNASNGSKLDALKWALLYQKNGQADLYGYKALPATFVPGLKNDLSAEDVEAAEAFAKSFSPLHLPAYAAPPRERRTERGARPDRPRSDGDRRRRAQ